MQQKNNEILTYNNQVVCLHAYMYVYIPHVRVYEASILYVLVVRMCYVQHVMYTYIRIHILW